MTLQLDEWHDRIGQDLKAFCDPGTELSSATSGRTITAEWVFQTEPQRATFLIDQDDPPQVIFREQKLSYRSFFAGPTIGDLHYLSKMILQATKPEIFVGTRAELVDEHQVESRPAIGLLQEVLVENPGQATRVIMVTGEPGAGKTRVLQQLVRKQAGEYNQGRATTLYLYINAQGRALASLGEAIAAELDDLRARRLHYHSIATLVRIGAVVPIIDGFDELLGVSGYDDAFSSLATFLEELNGAGQIVASARSTYYEEEFAARATGASALGTQIWSQVPVRVKAWTDAEVRFYAKARAVAVGRPGLGETIVEQLDKVFVGSAASLRYKPLFATRTIDLLAEGREVAGGEDLLKDLADAYLKREVSEKLRDRPPAPGLPGEALLTEHQLETMLAVIAEEMWNQEKRELDRASLRDVAEYVLDDQEVLDSARRVVNERISKLAFLSSGSRAGSVRFEHELFFSYFLGAAARSYALGAPEGLRVFLGRSILPSEVPRSLVRRLAPDLDQVEIRNLLDRLRIAGVIEGLRVAQVRENAGALIAELFKVGTESFGPIEDAVISDVTFAGGDLDGIALVRPVFTRVVMRRVDLTDFRVLNGRANQLWLIEVVVDPESTRLELQGLDPAKEVFGLRALRAGSTPSLYDPREVHEILIRIGAAAKEDQQPAVRDVPPAFVELLRKLMIGYGRANPVCLADGKLRNLFRDAKWPILENLLVTHGLVSREVRQMHGTGDVYLRRHFLPEQFMAGLRRDAEVPDSVSSFWTALEDAAAAL